MTTNTAKDQQSLRFEIDARYLSDMQNELSRFEEGKFNGSVAPLGYALVTAARRDR